MKKNLRKELSLIGKFKTWYGKRSVIVLTMGKVGTLTICRSLDNLNYKHVHPHSLFFSYPGTHFLKNVELTKSKHYYFLLKSLFKRIKVFIWLKTCRSITIITGVRDPFSRFISAFFEQSHYLGINPINSSESYLLNKLENHGNFFSTFKWFDEEIKRILKIDIYDHPFDKKLGYSEIQSGKIKILIFRLDKLNLLEKQFQTFLDERDFKLTTENITENNPNYNLIKKKYKFDEERIDYACRSRYLNHFYTDEEITKLKDKWRSE